MMMYCGNNRLDRKVVSGQSRIGTRYQCFQKGIGKGMHMPPYETAEYDPICKDKIYCGNQSQLPAGYDRFGSLHQCLQKGIGVGRKIQTPPPPPRDESVFFLPNRKRMCSTMHLILYAVLIAVLGVVGYYGGKQFTSVGPMWGAGIGIAAGVAISGVVYYMTPSEEYAF